MISGGSGKKRAGQSAQNPDAIDLAMRGQALLQRGATVTKDSNDASRALFGHALGVRLPQLCRSAGGQRLYLYDGLCLRMGSKSPDGL